MFVKLRRTDKKRRDKLTQKTLPYPKEVMKGIMTGLNRESKSWRAITQDAKTENVWPMRRHEMLPHAENFELGWWYLRVKVTVSHCDYKALNIYVITALNVSFEEIEVNRKFHVVAGLGSNVTSWVKWIIKLILAIQALQADDVSRKKNSRVIMLSQETKLK